MSVFFAEYSNQLLFTNQLEWKERFLKFDGKQVTCGCLGRSLQNTLISSSIDLFPEFSDTGVIFVVSSIKEEEAEWV